VTRGDAQLSLFETDDETDSGCPATETDREADTPCPASETATTLSQVRDRRRITRLNKLAGELARATGPLDQARLAVEIRDLAESIVSHSVHEANASGSTWREIGAQIGVPFQTAFRRYGRPIDA
jgi:hypothetical protein